MYTYTLIKTIETNKPLKPPAVTESTHAVHKRQEKIRILHNPCWCERGGEKKL